MIPEIILNELKKETKIYPRDYFRMSEAGDCQRKIQYKLIGTESSDAIGDRAFLVFHQGNEIHTEIKRLLYNADWRISRQEKPVEINMDGLKIVGHIDGYISKIKKILEIKTINRFSFEKILKEKEPTKETLGQLQLYLYAAAQEKITNEGLLLYVCKDTMRMQEIPVFLDLNIVNQVIEKFYTIQSSIKNNQIIERPFTNPKEQWQCSYCQYQTLCWQDYIDSNELKQETVELSQYKNEFQKWNELKEKQKEIEKEIDEYKSLFEKELINNNAKMGVVDGYVIERRLQRRISLNTEKIKTDFQLTDEHYKTSEFYVLKTVKIIKIIGGEKV